MEEKLKEINKDITQIKRKDDEEIAHLKSKMVEVEGRASQVKVKFTWVDNKTTLLGLRREPPRRRHNKPLQGIKILRSSTMKCWRLLHTSSKKASSLAGGWLASYIHRSTLAHLPSLEILPPFKKDLPQGSRKKEEKRRIDFSSLDASELQLYTLFFFFLFL